MIKYKCLSLEYLKKLFILDENIPSGLRWKISRRRIKIGNAAGTLNKKTRYYTVGIDGKNYLNHRIIFCMVNNIEMINIDLVDHIDQNKQNNHPTNLRQATHSENLKNRNKIKTNTSGYIGVTYHKRDRIYQAKLKNNLKR